MTTLSALSALSATANRINAGADSPTPQNAFTDLVGELKTSDGQEQTVKNSDGSYVTTVPTPGGKTRVVSYTSALGLTATEVGYVSPVLLNRFLSSLFQNLPTDAASVSPSTSSVDSSATSVASSASATALSAYRDDLEGKVRGLIEQLGTGKPQQSSLESLQSAFDQLMQGSGIDAPSGASGATPPLSALQNFLTAALPSIVSGELSASGIRINTSA